MDLDCLKRRALLNSPDAPPDKLAQLGRDFVVAGFLNDALDFLDKAGDLEGLTRLLAVVFDEGHVFLFARIKGLLGQPIEPREWEALADNAERLGKNSFAARARERLEAMEREADSI